MLIFDHINHTVRLNHALLKLQPLSFRLLETLAQSPEEVLSVDTLIESVWGTVTVSPDTLKQRVFLLRKAIEESELKGISIQAVRSEGYRLLFEPQPNLEAPYLPRFGWKLKVAAGIAAILLVSALGLLVPNQPNLFKNNRVVLWSNLPVQVMPAASANVFEIWRNLMTTSQPPRNFQLIFSELQKNVAMPVQARKSRAALISLFEVLHLDGAVVVRLSIIEGSTATVLRSDLLSANDESVNQIMHQQIASIEALIDSGALSLQKAQRENAEDPIWQDLKRLAQHKNP